MKSITAARAKIHFGEFLDMAQREPVVVTRNNRPVSVMFSLADLEDTVWAERARSAKAEGMIGATASSILIADLLDAKN
ncbi:MAG: type II toxin-antitoxin system Phd/YefM family antitoxin [Phyllobacteriaceae bacterium]|nr:type II toxin-antitoxin system Phd/YefM family antitoxin [Phyllobacteriaceae bacterium]